MAELNPEIYKRLDYSSIKSKQLLVSVFAFHQDYDRVKSGRVANAALQKTGSIESKRLVDLIHRDGLAQYKQSAALSLRELNNRFNSIFDPEEPTRKARPEGASSSARKNSDP